MTLFMVDVETDGPAPGLFSMVSLGCVSVDRQMTTTFKATFAPISDRFNPDALAISNIDRATHEGYPYPAEGMAAFAVFLEKNSKGGPVFIADNLAFDWSFTNYYFHRFVGRNPFGHSGRRIGDFHAGLEKKFGAAKGNVEALLHIADRHGVKLPE
jgi:DNA polymerase III epsilon subunit-like protein